MDLYSTGEMIDLLQVGEVAETDDQEMRVVKCESGHIKDTKDEKFVFLNNAIVKSKWRIIPKEVSFEEAKEALRVGKIVKCELPISKRVSTYTPNGDVISYSGDSITWEQIFKGKWTIQTR